MCCCSYPAPSLLTGSAISCPGGTSSSPTLLCSLSNYQATLSLLTPHLSCSLRLHLPSLPGQERGLHTAGEHLLHLVQHIPELQQTHTARGLSIRVNSSFQSSEKSLYSPFTNHQTFAFVLIFQWLFTRVKKKKNICGAFCSFYQFLPLNAASQGCSLGIPLCTPGARAAAALGLSTQQAFFLGTNSICRNYLINRRTQLL